MKKIFILLSAISLAIASTMAAIPAGYYHAANGKHGAELKTALFHTITNASMLAYGNGYGYTWYGFYNTDRDTNNTVIDMYSNTVRHFTDTMNFTAVEGMHIEHALAKSCWNATMNDAAKDLFNLYPADGAANIAKTYYDLGEVANATFDNGSCKVGPASMPGYVGSVFEPADEYKGDFARTYFYMVTKYENFSNIWQSGMLNNNTYPVFKQWAIDMLLRWHQQDPVSPKEIARNEAVYQIQGNRNPFIDFPDLVEHIWGNDTAVDYQFPATTQPFLISPTRWDKITFNGFIVGDTLTEHINVEGVNLQGNILFALANNSNNIQLSTTQITAAQAIAGYDLSIKIFADSAQYIRDTLIITNDMSNITVAIPLKGLSTNAFMALPATEITSASARLNWMAYPQATTYLLDLYQNGDTSGDLLFTAYVEGSSWDKAVAIYNNTGKAINLADYEIRKQNNGTGNFVGNERLSGILPNGNTYIIAHGGASAALAAIADTLLLNDQTSVMAFNGNDAIALYHNGIQIDVIGIEDSSNEWGTDVTLIRKNTIYDPCTNFDWNEWNIFPSNTLTGVDNHTLAPRSNITYMRNHVNVGNVTSYYVDYEFHPWASEVYCVYAITTTGDTIPTENGMHFITSALEAPYALEATNITASSFTASWEEVNGAMDYLISLYQLSEGDTLTTVQGFDSVYTNARPLPNGWQGNLTSTYTTAASSGASTPAMAFKTQGDWLQTERYPGNVIGLSFMYRFVNAGIESSFVLEAGDGYTVWRPIDTIFYTGTSKITKTYTFDKDSCYSAFRWNYVNKRNANLSLDDVSATYLEMDTTFILKDRRSAVTIYPIGNLNEGETYYYHVKSFYCHLASAPSNVIKVFTADQPTTDPDDPPTTIDYTDNGVQLYANNNSIVIDNAEIPSMVNIYTIDGRLLHREQLVVNYRRINLDVEGVVIVQIIDSTGVKAYKLIMNQ